MSTNYEYLTDPNVTDNTAKLSAEEVTEVLNDWVGATGSAKIVKGDLMVQSEENSDWSYCGTVADVEGAKAQIQEYFNQ